MSAKYKSPSFLLPNELNTSANPANDTGINSLYSMDFDGSSQYINTPQIDLGSTNSISFWINNTASNSGTLFGDPNAYNTTYALSWSTTANILSFRLGNGDNGYWQLTVSSGLLRDGNWHHHCLTRDGVTINYYIDGVLQTNVTNNTLNASAGTNTTIKNIMARSNGTSFASGKLDEVAIFNRALNTTEIAALYGGTSPNIYPSNLMATDLGPIAYYPLGEQAQNTGYLDPSNPGNDIAGSEWQFPNGVLQDYVMDFDGVNDFIDLGNLQPSTTSLSISAWAYKTDTSNASIIGRGSSVDYGIFVYSGSLQFGINAGGWTTISTTLPVNQWFHVLATWDGTTMKLYVNGETPVTASKTGTITYTSNNTTIGKNSTLSGFEWDGKISNVAIWNTDQSANIANIYNNGSPQTTYTVTPQNWWKLNADSVYTPSAPNYTKALKLVNVTSTSIDSIDFTQGLLNNLSEFTVSFWYNRLTNGGNTGTILKQTGVFSVSQHRYVAAYSGIEVSLTTSNGTFNITASGQGVVSLNEWLHVSIVYDGSNITLYRNGTVADGTSIVAATGNTVTNTNNFKLEPLAYNEQFLASNLAFYNTALTSTQISTLFNFGTPETNISFSPQAWWKLNDQNAITDSSGNGNTGTNNGATDISSGVAVVPSWKIPDASGTSNGVSTTLPSTALQQSDLQFDSPYSNYSLSFDGNSYIEASGSNLPTGNSSFTASCWFKRNGVQANYAGILNWGTTSQRQNVYINFAPGGTSLKFGFYQDDLASSGYYATSDNVWYNVVLAYNGSIAKMYVNGSLQASHTLGGALNISNSNPIIIGKTNTYYFDGKIDETAIFNTELTSSQILEIYNNGRPNDLTTFSGTAPISWWRLGENAYFNNNSFVVPNSISGAPNGTGSGSITTMISADAPGTYANGIGSNLAILDRVGDAPLSTSNSQSYNMIPSDISPYVPGYVGLQTDNIYSMNFDSASADYISIGSLINLGTSSTISFWYKTSSNNQGLVPFGGASAPYYYVVQWGSLVNKVYFRVGTTVHEFTGVTEIEDGSWHHYCIVRTGADAELFVDGNSRDTLTGLPSATDTLIDTIGATSNGTSNLNNSYLDEVGFWNTALNADQVNFDLYQPSLPAGSNKTADIANNPNLPTPVAWYRMGD